MKRWLRICIMMGSYLGSNSASAQEERRQQLIDRIKKQNTLLTSDEYPIGVYNQDLVNAGFFMSYLVADTMLYKVLRDRTADATMKAIVRDLDGLIAVLEHTKHAEDRFEERMAFAAYQGDTTMSVDKKRMVLFNPLRRYLNVHHRVDSLFSKKTLSALGLRWLYDRLTSLVEKEFVVRAPSVLDQLVGSLDQDVQYAHTHAFTVGDGERTALERAPFSATTGVKLLGFFVSPLVTFRASMRSGALSYGVWRLSVLNRLLGTGLPEGLFSQTVESVVEALELAGAVSFFNDLMRYHWIRFVVKRRYELLRLLYAYRYVLEDPTGQEHHVHLIEDEIRDFVTKGFSRNTLLPGASLQEWWSSQGKSTGHLTVLLRYATLALLGLKSAHWLYEITQGY